MSYKLVKWCKDYLRDHQYDEGVKIVCQDYYPVLFREILDEYGTMELSFFPSGKEVFVFVKEK